MNDAVKLYELGNARDILDTWLSESEGELTPEIAELLDGLEGQIEAKVQGVGLYIRELGVTADAIKAEAARLSARAKACERAAESLKGYLKSQLDRLGHTSVKGTLCTVAIQKNSQPSVTYAVEGEALYALLGEGNGYVAPVERVEYPIDRAAVLADWKAGKALPEAITVVLGSHVRIR